MNLLLILSVILSASCVRIEENGYRGVTISFSKEILQESFQFEKLKDVLTKASEILFHATRNRSYFEEFVIVFPSTWSETDICDESVTEIPKNVDIYVTDSLDVPYLTTQHSKGCGQKGDVIYLPIDWLTGNIEDLAPQFVRKWSTYRYGIFPEDPERLRSCVASSDSTWSPVGCYNVDLNERVDFDEDGLPLCGFPDNFNRREDLLSSIMFSANSSTVLNFCDGSDSFPHNPIAPTLHNRLCGGNSVWSVIMKTEDYLYGRNLPLKDGLPKNPIFRCFKETKTHLTLVVQDTDSEARTEIRYALFHFLSIVEPTDFSVSLTSFSNDTLTEEVMPVELNLKDKKKLKLLLDSHLKLNEKVPNICLTCGLRKAYEVSTSSEYPLRVVILLARESSLEDTKMADLIEIMQSDPNAFLYLLFLEDTAKDIIPSSLVDAVLDSGGRIFRIKNNAVFMLAEINVALLDASKSIFHPEDKILVMQKKEYLNVKSDITDVFLTPKKTKGKLLYSMQCEKRGDMRNIDNTCSDPDPDLPSPICGSEVDLNDDEDTETMWSYTFKYTGGIKGTTCSSLAVVKLESSAKSPFTLKGWLSENKITPGRDVLIIYAEIFGSEEQDFEVEARISGPGLEDFRLELRDNGNGDPDTVKEDNIYSRYFTSYAQKGTYTVSIFAKALVASVNKTYADADQNSGENTKTVTQTKVIGTFRATQSTPAEDIFPPNRISDLRLTSVDNINRKISLQWTAPGDDYDYGKATKYIIKLSNKWMSLMDFTFNLKENVLLKPDEYEAANSGIIQNVKVQCPLSKYKETYYIALQAADDKNNKGRISNILQIHFKDPYFPSNDSVKVSTETLNDYNQTTNINLTSLVTTEEFTISFTSSEIEITSDKNTSLIPTNETKVGIFVEKNIFIISTSVAGGFILLVIIINIIVCFLCFKNKYPEKTKKVSRKESLRPPYNINMAYKHGSETSLDEENLVSHSLSTTVTPNSIYSRSDGSVQEKRYTYHTNRSLKNKMESQTRKNDDLGFKLVQSMPAYATSSLSRFAARHACQENEALNTKSDSMQLQKFNNTEDTHIYHLGEV